MGTASGTLGRMLAQAGEERKYILDGIEPESQWAQIAHPYYDTLLITGLEEAPDAFLGNHQVVVLADVLEHLADPAKALRRLVGLQPAGATFIISVPNIANLWVRLNLLLGHFDYAERGILDRTHLRFFTRKTLLQLLAEQGLAVQEMQVTPIPLGLVNPLFERTPEGRAMFSALATLTGMLPKLLGYQFIVVAEKCDESIGSEHAWMKDVCEAQDRDRAAGIQRRENFAAHAGGDPAGVRPARHFGRRLLDGQHRGGGAQCRADGVLPPAEPGLRRQPEDLLPAGAGGGGGYRGDAAPRPPVRRDGDPSAWCARSRPGRRMRCSARACWAGGRWKAACHGGSTWPISS